MLSDDNDVPALGAQVADELRVRIVSGDLEPGTHLVEGLIATEYDVSRSPVREALRELQSEGLVEQRRRGTFVLGLTEADVDELLGLRLALECLVVRTAMRVARTEDWKLLEVDLEAMKAAAQANDSRGFALADMAFHTRVYELADHRRAAHMWSLYEKTFTAILQLSKSGAGDLWEALTTHEDLLDIMKSGDVQRAENALKRHLEGTRALFLAAIAPQLQDIRA